MKRETVINKLSSKGINVDDFIKVCDESISMSKACSNFNLHFNTFKRYAVILDCYNTNQSGKGMSKRSAKKFNIFDIIYKNKHPQYSTYKLKNRLFDEGIKKYECEVCGIYEWMGESAPLELDHIDGDRHNHYIDNLRILCPNCHAQTETHCGKNIDTKLLAKKREKNKNKKPKNKPKKTKTNKLKKKQKNCLNPDCNNNHNNREYCSHDCYHKCGNSDNRPDRRKVKRPSYNKLMKEINETNYSAVGRKYGVSDNAIRKWIKRYEEQN